MHIKIAIKKVKRQATDWTYLLPAEHVKIIFQIKRKNVNLLIKNRTKATQKKNVTELWILKQCDTIFQPQDGQVLLEFEETHSIDCWEELEIN